MKHYESKVVTTTREILVGRTCELCHQRWATSSETEWSSSPWFIGETEVRLKDGRSDPDGGGFGKEIVIDICLSCFRAKLIPWLQSQGAQVRETEWSS